MDKSRDASHTTLKNISEKILSKASKQQNVLLWFHKPIK